MAKAWKRTFRRSSTRASKCLFVWIPKTAGTSLATWLQPAGMLPVDAHSASVHSPAEYGDLLAPECVCFGHMNIDDLIRRGLVTRGQLAKWWSFTVVRNPYSRALSLYEHAKRTGWIAPNQSLLEFLLGLKQGLARPGAYNSIGLSFANPQTHWLEQSLWDGPSHVFHLEELPELEQTLKARYPQLTGSVGHLNRSSARARHRAPSEAIPLIHEIYVQDFLELGYSFDQDLVPDIEWSYPWHSAGVGSATR